MREARAETNTTVIPDPEERRASQGQGARKRENTPGED